MSKPAFHCVIRNVLEMINLRADAFAAPLKGIVEYPAPHMRLKNIGAIRVVIPADIPQNAVHRLRVLRLTQIFSQEMLYRLFPAVLPLLHKVHTTPLKYCLLQNLSGFRCIALNCHL